MCFIFTCSTAKNSSPSMYVQVEHLPSLPGHQPPVAPQAKAFDSMEAVSTPLGTPRSMGLGLKDIELSEDGNVAHAIKNAPDIALDETLLPLPDSRAWWPASCTPDSAMIAAAKGVSLIQSRLPQILFGQWEDVSNTGGHPGDGPVGALTAHVEGPSLPEPAVYVQHDNLGDKHPHQLLSATMIDAPSAHRASQTSNEVSPQKEQPPDHAVHNHPSARSQVLMSTPPPGQKLPTTSTALADPNATEEGSCPLDEQVGFDELLSLLTMG